LNLFETFLCCLGCVGLDLIENALVKLSNSGGNFVVSREQLPLVKERGNILNKPLLGAVAF